MQNFKLKLKCLQKKCQQVDAVNSQTENRDAAPEKKVGKVIKFNKSAYEKKMALKKEKEEAKEVVVKDENKELVLKTTESKED